MTINKTGFNKKQIEKSGIILRADFSNIFTNIFIGELNIERRSVDDSSGGVGRGKITVVTYGAYVGLNTCLVTEFLIDVKHRQKGFKNYFYLPCQDKDEVDKQLLFLSENNTKSNAEYLGDILEDILNKFFTSKENNSEKKL